MIRRREFDAALIIQLELFEVSKHKLPEAAKNLLGYLVSRPHKRNRLDAKVRGFPPGGCLVIWFWKKRCFFL